MSVLDRTELEASPLADLHAIASQLGVDGFRRLRKTALVDSILGVPTPELDDAPDAAAAPADAPSAPDDAEPSASASAPDADGDADADADAVGRDEPTEVEVAAPAPRERTTSRSRRGGRSRSGAGAGAGPGPGADRERERDVEPDPDPEERTPRAETRERGSGRSRGAEPQGGDREERRERGADRERDRDRGADRDAAPEREEAAERIVVGVVELLGNGSGFLRVDPPEPSDDDVYVSAAQVRRCELVSGDRVGGPVRAPRRSERYPSLIRIDTINGAAADAVAEGTPFDDLPADFASERFAFGGEDPSLTAIEWLTPFGRGSRVSIAGPARAGKSEILRALVRRLAADPGLEVSVVLAGVRPEEIAAWRAGGPEPIAALGLAAPADAQGQAVERAVETSRRVAARGGHAVVAIDSLDGLHPSSARRALAAARNLRDGGSLTVIAVTSQPLGGETTVITLDPALTSARRFPALDLGASGTLRPELLVGADGAEAIAQARAALLD